MKRSSSLWYFGELVKFPLSLSIALSSSLGYVLQSNQINGNCFGLFFSIFLLACGAAALNNYQDRSWDLLLSRTKGRVIPSGAVHPYQAIVLAVVLILTGAIGLYFLQLEWPLPALGILAIVLYNFIYTPLKKRSLWAIVPGMACGSLPPLMGWLAAGGQWNALDIWLVMLVFALWQIPHFWLILLSHYSDYERPSVPNMLNHFSQRQLERICFLWVMIFAILTLFLPLFRVVETNVIGLLLFLNAVLLTGAFAMKIFFFRKGTSYQSTFIHLNASLAVFMLLLATEKLI